MVIKRPGEIEAVLGLARNLRWAGRSAEAAQILKAHQTQFDMDGRYLSELGKVKLILGNSTEGVMFLEQATHKVTDDWRLYSALGIGLDNQKNYGQAEVAYRKALDMCPDDPAVINNLGISQGLSGRMDQAIITLQRALSYGSHSDKIKRNLDLFIDARDLCDSCGATYLKTGNGMILAAGLMSTDKEGPCTPEPKYTAKAPVMVQKLAPKAAIPSINIKVYFEFDSDILKPEALGVLNNLGKALTYGELNNYRFQIAGHTDAVGPEAYNQSLSERRAQSVVQYLRINFNIDPARIDAVGYGESQLLDPSMPDGDVNRRVQVTRLSKL
ncbi:MAG: OmpA family protein [Magnetovibrio sp.]|nr:OmpA family protein [Magnetovibrio sp.]